MLNLSDCKLREYDGKECISFTVDVQFGDKNLERLWFNKSDETKWGVHLILPSGELFVSEYDVYSRNQKLEIVAAAGLLAVQKKLEEDVVSYSQLEHSIAELVRGL